MTRSWLVQAGWSLLALVLVLFVALASWEPFFAEQPGPPPPAKAYTADISRDEFGVPHIHGRTDPDVAFGVAYAHAEDDFSTLQDVVAMTRGRYGAIAGQDGAGVDFAYHWLGARQTAHNHYGELPTDVRGVLDAYASNRARRAVRLLAEPGPISRDRLLAIKFDTGYERAGYVAYMLDGIAKLDLRGDPQLAKAQALMAGWDLMADGKGPADALAVMVLEEAMSASYGLRPMPDPKAELAKAAGHLIKYFGRLDPPLGDVIRIRQSNVDLPDDGGGDTLRAATSWNVDPDGRLSIKHGDSFVMLIEWGKDGTVHSESVQPYGAATTRKNDPHYADQAALFVAHKFKPVWFTRADVAAHAVRRETVSN